MNKRNNLVELARFVFSILVIGYHLQMAFLGDGTHLFENGAIAVEFFFLLSGYFFAKAIEKASARQDSNVIKSTFSIMKSKIKGIFATHIIAIIAIFIIIGVLDNASFNQRLTEGILNIFLLQNAPVWTNTFENAFIVPEWYLSAMLLCMLFMTPIALLLRKKIKGPLVTLSLVGVLGVVVIITGFATSWILPTNFIMDVRAWGEMCVGMFAFYLVCFIKDKECKKISRMAFIVVEIVCYVAIFVLGFVPIPMSLQAMCMALTVIFTFIAILITFSNKGIQIANEKVNSFFGYLGSISLATYLFHPVIIDLLTYTCLHLDTWALYLITFIATIGGAVLYKFMAQLFKNGIVALKRVKCVKEQTV